MPKQQETAMSTRDQEVSFVPLAEDAEITLTINVVHKHFAKPTRKGAIATDSDIIKFMMLCKAGKLNPWTFDAYLVGYDGKDGPVFSLIVAHSALLKRAEWNVQFDGMESGVVCINDEGHPVYRQGDLIMPKETLLGGWARVFRKDRNRPTYDALNLEARRKPTDFWSRDPAGQIVKCAEASVLREAFPTELGGLYTHDEMGSVVQGAVVPIQGQNLSLPSPESPETKPDTERTDNVADRVRRGRRKPRATADASAAVPETGDAAPATDAPPTNGAPPEETKPPAPKSDDEEFAEAAARDQSELGFG